MNPLAMEIVIILAFCIIVGIFRGIVKEISSIIGVLGGFYAAYTYYMVFAKTLSRWISNTSYLNILSFLIIFCSVFIVISILGAIIKYLLNIAFLGWVDCIFGAGFGFIKGLLIVSIIFFILTSFLPKGAPVIKKSQLSPYLVIISEKMAKIVSKEMKHRFRDNIDELKRAWRNYKEL